MIYYIDFDGVIMDTETHLFDDYYKMLEKGINITDREYIENLDWEAHLRRSGFIKDSLEALKAIKKEVIILGKVCSKQEEDAKRKILKEADYNKPMIFTYFQTKKCDAEGVNPVGNVLVDDTIHNLDDWNNAGGYPLYFNKDGNQTDPWDNINTKYKTTKTLKLLYELDKDYFKKHD